MARRVGIGGYFGLGEETTYGTPVTRTKFFELAPGDDSLMLELDTLEAAHTVERVVDIADTGKGAKRVSGSLSHDVRFGGGWGVLLEHLCGARFSTAGTTTYTHTLAVGTSGAALQGKGLSLEIFRDGILQGSDNSWLYVGIRPTALEFSVQDNAFARAAWTLMGSGLSYVSPSTAAYTTASWMKSPSDAATPTSTLRYGTDGSETAYTCRNWTMKLEQAHDELRNASDPAMIEPAVSDRLLLTVTAEILFQGTSTAGDAFSANYQAKTAKSLLLKLEGPTAANESFTIDMPDVLITAPPDPHASAAGAIWQTVSFKAYADGAGNPASIVLVNSDSALFS